MALERESIRRIAELQFEHHSITPRYGATEPGVGVARSSAAHCADVQVSVGQVYPTNQHALGSRRHECGGRCSFTHGADRNRSRCHRR